MNKLIRKALKSTSLLYFILFLAIVNILGYLSMGQFDAVVVFAIIGFVAQSFSKNMIMILTIPIILTALYVTLFHTIKEGLENKHSDEKKHSHGGKHSDGLKLSLSGKHSDGLKLGHGGKHSDGDKHSHGGKHSDGDYKISKHNCHQHSTEKDCAEPCKWNKESNKCHSTTHHKKNKEQLAQLHPQWIKDDEKTEEEFYKSVNDNIPDLGIQDMADKTSQLIEKQKKLRSSMDKILPLVDQTNKFMDSINLDKLTGVLGGLNSNN